MRNGVTYLLLMLTVLFLLQGCHTEPKTGTLTGIVILDNDTLDPAKDPVDYSGITVSLYPTASLDTTMVRINSVYPQIGVHLSQETDFDHRDHQAVKSTATTADGSFKLEGLEGGTYNLAVFKVGWGIKYLYNVEVYEGETLDLDPISLYPVEEFTSTVTDNITLKSDHCYLVDGETNFIGSVVLQPNTRIYAQPGSMMRFYGAVEMPDDIDIDDAWRLMSAKDMYASQPSTIGANDFYSSVGFFSNPVTLRNGIIKHVSNSVALQGATNNVTNCMIRYCGSGLIIPSGAVSISNVIIANGTDDQTNYGISIQSSGSVSAQITKSMIMNMYYGININSVASTFDINNCYFYDSYRAIYDAYATGTITHNAFELNTDDIAQYSVGLPVDVSYNNFFHSRRIGVYPWFVAEIHNNNFFKTDGNFVWIRAEGLSNNCSVHTDVDATYNYWAVVDIETYLMDATDNPDYPNSPIPYEIIYMPKRDGRVSSAGIQ
jgi:hypothetical protein